MVSVILLLFVWLGLLHTRLELLPPVGAPALHMLRPDFVSPLDRCEVSGSKTKIQVKGRHKTELTCKKQAGMWED